MVFRSDLPTPERHTLVHGDICDRDLVGELFHQHRIDTVVHFAAETHVDRSILDPQPFIQTNIVGTYTLREAARQFWQVEKSLPSGVVRFHHISTDEVFGTLSRDDPAFSETTPYHQTRPMQPAKQPATTWCAPITIHFSSPSPSPTAPTTTGHTSFLRS